MTMTDMGRVAPAERRTELDWLRIGAFALLILFHVGMFYTPWQWEVKSPRILPWLQIPMDWSTPWRLLLLFVVSGAATRFMARRLPPLELWKTRSIHLLPPVLFAVLILTPPQMYLRVVEQFHYSGSFRQFLSLYFGFGEPFCRPDECPAMPNWDHLWFVVYLWIYTSLLLALLTCAPRLVARAKDAGVRRLDGWRLLVIPAALLGMIRAGLGHAFPETHGLTDDWYLHAIYFLAFLFGFMFVFSPEIWRGMVSLRWSALAIALASYAAHTGYMLHYQTGMPIPLAMKAPMALVYGYEQWAWIVAALGFGRLYLAGRDGPLRRYLTQAIFPYYVIHQPAIVIAAHELAKLDLPLWLEATLLILSTIAVCGLTFEIVRRISMLHPWFGLKAVEIASPASAPLRWPAT